MIRVGDEVLVLVTDESEDEVRAILTALTGGRSRAPRAEPERVRQQRVGGVEQDRAAPLLVGDALEEHAAAVPMPPMSAAR